MQLTEHRVLTDFQVMMRDGVILIDLEELIVLIWAMIAIIAAWILVAILASVLV